MAYPKRAVAEWPRRNFDIGRLGELEAKMAAKKVAAEQTS